MVLYAVSSEFTIEATTKSESHSYVMVYWSGVVPAGGIKINDETKLSVSPFVRYASEGTETVVIPSVGASWKIRDGEKNETKRSFPVDRCATATVTHARTKLKQRNTFRKCRGRIIMLRSPSLEKLGCHSEKRKKTAKLQVGYLKREGGKLSTPVSMSLSTAGQR